VAALSLLFVDITSGINRAKRLVKHDQALFTWRKSCEARFTADQSNSLKLLTMPASGSRHPWALILC